MIFFSKIIQSTAVQQMPMLLNFSIRHYGIPEKESPLKAQGFQG